MRINKGCLPWRRIVSSSSCRHHKLLLSVVSWGRCGHDDRHRALHLVARRQFHLRSNHLEGWESRQNRPSRSFQRSGAAVRMPARMQRSFEVASYSVPSHRRISVAKVWLLKSSNLRALSLSSRQIYPAPRPTADGAKTRVPTTTRFNASDLEKRPVMVKPYRGQSEKIGLHRRFFGELSKN